MAKCYKCGRYIAYPGTCRICRQGDSSQWSRNNARKRKTGY